MIENIIFWKNKNMQYYGWLFIIIAAFIIAWILAKLIYVWFSKPSKHDSYMSIFAGGGDPKDDNGRFNQRLFWSSYSVFFLASIFLLPCYLGDILCIK